MPSSWSYAVQVLTGFINRLDNVYLVDFWLNQTLYTISLLDILEIIFGIGLMRSLMNTLWGFTDKVNERG